jgi:hypothetical protein
MTRKKELKSRIPEFASLEEEAAWWDTHDITDYLDELKPARVRFAQNRPEGITIRLDPETLAILRTQAQEKGLFLTTMVRMWILEQMQETHQGHRHPSSPA